MDLDLKEETKYSPLFLKVLRNKGFEKEEDIELFLSGDLKDLHDPFLMKGMTDAVDRIKKAVRAGEKILVHGDYDVDGITGAAILARLLKELGADFKTFLPCRNEDGYGVSLNAIKEASDAGTTLLITADCGITAHEQIKAAKALGVDVIVIDHHRIPEKGIPAADVILNPQQEDCPYPFVELSAGGLAFKLAQALIGERAFKLLDLATLSTICDIAPLKGENRIIVKKGLETLGMSSNVGVKALAKVSKIRTRKMNVGHVGFMLGPRINAAGRMSSADIALQLLLTDSEREAESLATVLDEENKARQKEERQVVKQAIDEVERSVNFAKEKVIVVAREGWHAGVIGIVASRLVDRFYRPSVVIALKDGEGKGSGRSVKGFHLFNAMSAAAEHLDQFGGHEQAAGLSVQAENISLVRQKMNEYAEANVKSDTFVKTYPCDLKVSLEDFTSNFMRELEMLEPHGAGNSRPIFYAENVVVKQDPKKQWGSSYKFLVMGECGTYEAVWNDKTGSPKYALLEKGAKIDLWFTIKIKVWDGIESLTLEVKDFKRQ